MLNSNTLTPSQKLIIQTHKETLLKLRLYKSISKYLESLGIDKLSPQFLYDLLFDSEIKHCSNSKFISFSVGYRACRKGCDCYNKNLSNKIKNIKKEYSQEQKNEIYNKVKKTVQEKYNVDNVFQLDAIKTQSKTTKKNKYGDENYRNEEKIRQTNLEKYGEQNPMQAQSIREDYYKNFHNRDFKKISETVKTTKKAKYGDENYRNEEKIQQTNREKYGVDNPAKSSEIKNKISKNLKSRIYDRTLIRYGDKIQPCFTKDEYINGVNGQWMCSLCNNTIDGKIINGLIPRCLNCFPYTVSKFEIEVRNFIKTLIDPTLISFNNRSIIHPKELDIVIESKKLAFECNGIYRHSEISGNKTKNYHLQKSLDSSTLGYSLMHIWDIDWYKSQNIIKSMIRHKLGLSNKLYAKHAQIKQLSHKESTEFFDQNHLQGSVNSAISLGLIIDNKIISAMSFTKSRYDKNTDWELLRFCNIINFTVVGAASKLLKYFKKHVSGTIITYADRSYGSDSFYETIGFTKVRYTPPGYFYVKNGMLISRIKFQKHKLSKILNMYDPTKTEWQNMMLNGYDRIWNCGNTVYILK